MNSLPYFGVVYYDSIGMGIYPIHLNVEKLLFCGFIPKLNKNGLVSF